MVSRFEHLKKLHIDGKTTARFEISQLDTPPGSKNKHPVLIVRPATEENKEFWNQVVKRLAKNSKAYKGGRTPQDVLDDNFDEDLRLYPLFVIDGWEDVYEDGNKPAPFSSKAAAEYIQALPRWIFQQVRNFCADQENFIQPEMPTHAEVVEQAGN